MLPLGGSLGEYSLNDLEEQPGIEVTYIFVIYIIIFNLWQMKTCNLTENMTCV